MHIERIDARELDLDTADAMAAVSDAANRADGVDLPPLTGPGLLTYLRLQSDGTPVAGVWVARRSDGCIVGRAALQLPFHDNTDSAYLRGAVHPEERRRGVGRALLDEAVTLARQEGRTKLYAGSFDGSPGGLALPALGFAPLGTVDAVRRIDLTAQSPADRQRWYDEARARAGDYELVRLQGPTPPDLVDDLVTLHEAINDAPLDDPDMEDDAWSAERVLAYDRAMAGRHQTVYRVLARHRATGEWAGMSLLCVDEFSPSVGLQEDTSVVRAHRGHRLGLLMKVDMLRRLADERPEVTSTITWNATTNHHMIAVNEALGATVVTHHTNHRLVLEQP